MAHPKPMFPRHPLATTPAQHIVFWQPSIRMVATHLGGLMNRFAICLVTLLAAFFPVHGRTKPHYTFILPDGYVGWVQAVFGDSDASPLLLRNDGGYEIDVPETGIPRTSDLLVMDFKRQDEFYYRALLPSGKTELRPVPPEYVLPGVLHSGFSVGDTGGKGRGYSWFLFIGPPEVRARIPLADFTKAPGYGKKMMAPEVYPTPGRLPSATSSSSRVADP